MQIVTEMAQECGILAGKMGVRAARVADSSPRLMTRLDCDKCDRTRSQIFKPDLWVSDETLSNDVFREVNHVLAT